MEISQFVPLEVGKLHRWSHSDVDVDLAWRACALMLSRVCICWKTAFLPVPQGWPALPGEG